MKVIAVIPARGGSKSLPRKNIVPLLGFPLITYSIHVARHLHFVDEVIVSSDDEEILEISKQYGSDIIKRPVNISGDYSRDNELISHVKEVRKFADDDMVIFLRPSHPIRNPKTLQSAFELFKKEYPNFDSLRSMKRSNEIIFKTWGFLPNGKIIPAFNPELTDVPDPCNAPRQLLPPTFYQDGYVEIFPFKTVKHFLNLSGSKILPFIIEEYSNDIDVVEDLTQIENHLKSSIGPSWFTYPEKR